MFEVRFKILAEDPFRIKYLSQSINDVFKDLCEPVKIGASYICAPNQDTLLLIYFSSQLSKDMNASLKIMSNNATYVAEIMKEVNNRLRSQGFYITISETSTTSL
ncbi:conserved hypothetical protein [Sulfolobus islandicus Y.G.57.14]|jgi:hypothetical protein|uniref:Uncharacterized protein n=10 Tax=Saccharolobus islandicus TaxID=43080 RepID=M9U6L4_SACIS|nr:hypothetical protein [Sulfolobus islandicus]ACP35416.1 conserved hypothetical protein [Sulfolobus islandicus L.S.2.15]ACP38075.1 conserved hypothetical protein [Sulfolobus islandicus M.14.25]ACP45582.1 conserved hypothetical protein [Sulfolobus islandicus Y.G.57.14]ACP48630.1 conserved hypothetical protein [Sulfolobus islandicus Y.N.15.51]ACP55254.1 conserved hypothetical protein [Sulfolobus islandicus M.16.27]